MWGFDKRCAVCKTMHAREAMINVITIAGNMLVCNKCKRLYYRESRVKNNKKKKKRV